MTAIDRLAAETPPLTGPQEQTLCASKLSVEQKRLALWRHNLRYASLLAGEAFDRRYAHHICTREELNATAFVALWEATGTFEPDRGAKFISYAKWHLTRALENHLIESASGFSLPKHAIQKLGALKSLEETGSHTMRVSEGQFERARRYRTTVFSFDASVSIEGGGEDRYPLVPSEADVVREVETPELFKVLDDLLVKLKTKDERLPQMMRDYFGIGTRKHTYDQIAVKHKVTRQRIEQLVSRALRQLRTLVAAKKIKFQDLLA